jgi:hypothetical protein
MSPTHDWLTDRKGIEIFGVNQMFFKETRLLKTKSNKLKLYQFTASKSTSSNFLQNIRQVDNQSYWFELFFVQHNAKGEFLNEYKLLFLNPNAAVAFIACILRSR